MGEKRYKPKSNEELLARLVTQVVRFGSRQPDFDAMLVAKQNALVRSIRPVLGALLETKFGGIELSASFPLWDVWRGSAPLIWGWLQQARKAIELKDKYRGTGLVFTFELLCWPEKQRYRFEVSGSNVGNVVWFQTARLLQAVGRDRVKTCVCGQIYVKRGRREFCSDRCQKRDYMRRYRANEGS